jgi:DNA ligase-1
MLTDVEYAESAEMIQLHAYDCFDPTNPTMKFKERIALLDELSALVDDDIIKVCTTYQANSESEVQGFHDQFVEEGYEGAIIRLNGYYENKRSNNLLKMKEFIDEEFEITDIIEGIGNRSGMAGKIEYRNSKGQVFRSGIRGDVHYYSHLLDCKSDYIGKKGTVRYQNLSEDGIPRFPVTVAIRDYE